MDSSLTPRDWIVAAILLVMVATLFTVPAYVENQVDESQREINCTSVQANIDQLSALREIADQLGVPVTFQIPEVPAECAGS